MNPCHTNILPGYKVGDDEVEDHHFRNYESTIPVSMVMLVATTSFAPRRA